jgi:uncharacterized protein (TIGR03435 family)
MRNANRQSGMRVMPIVAALLAVPLTFAQSTRTPVAFDAASIKVYPPNGGPLGMQVDAGRVRYTNVSLGFLITRAYGLAGDQVIGIPNEFGYPLAYEIEAAFSPPSGPEQIPLMLQSLLADRFKLVVHRETREAPVYVLVVAQGGPKLKVSQAETMSLNAGQRGHLEAKKISAERLAVYLQTFGSTGRPVLDRTGLTGLYDLVLDYVPDDMKSENPDSRASLFTALEEQLGLKLEAQTAPREFLTIDRVEKPTGN